MFISFSSFFLRLCRLYVATCVLFQLEFLYLTDTVCASSYTPCDEKLLIVDGLLKFTRARMCIDYINANDDIKIN